MILAERPVAFASSVLFAPYGLQLKKKDKGDSHVKEFAMQHPLILLAMMTVVCFAVADIAQTFVDGCRRKDEAADEGVEF